MMLCRRRDARGLRVADGLGRICSCAVCVDTRPAKELAYIATVGSGDYNNKSNHLLVSGFGRFSISE